VTLWHPDTCGVFPGCLIQCDQVTGEPTSHVFRCSAHSGRGFDHAGVASECRLKENSRQDLADRLVALGKVADNAGIPWTINPVDGVIEVSVPAGVTITQAQRNTLASAIQTKFAGKVRLV
jgi:hypothetical protein